MSWPSTDISPGRRKWKATPNSARFAMAEKMIPLMRLILYCLIHISSGEFSLVSGKVIGFDTVRHFRFHRQPLICHQHFLAYMVPGIILQHPIPSSASHLIKRLSWTSHGVGKRGRH